MHVLYIIRIISYTREPFKIFSAMAMTFNSSVRAATVASWSAAVVMQSELAMAKEASIYIHFKGGTPGE